MELHTTGPDCPWDIRDRVHAYNTVAKELGHRAAHEACYRIALTFRINSAAKEAKRAKAPAK
jgi:hypothetical protein